MECILGSAIYLKSTGMSLVREMKLTSQMTQSAMILRNSPRASKMGSKERKVEEEKDKKMNS